MQGEVTAKNPLLGVCSGQGDSYEGQMLLYALAVFLHYDGACPGACGRQRALCGDTVHTSEVYIHRRNGLVCPEP